MADLVDEGNRIRSAEQAEISSHPKSPQKAGILNEVSCAGTSIPTPEKPAVLGETLDRGQDKTDERNLEDTLKQSVRDDIKKKIENILAEVQRWSDTEKLLLYLKLPGSKHRDSSKDEHDPHAMPLSTTRAEQTQAFHWIRCHLEECENNSTLPKHEVYDEYKAHCESVSATRVLSAPDFGKIIKCVFPNVKARRLGTRGNSKYCYSGIQKKRIVKSPQLPNLMAPASTDKSLSNGATTGSSGDKIGDDQTLVAACILVCEWANKLLGRVFGTLTELARFLVGGSYVSSKSMAAFVVMSSNETSGSCNKLTLNSLKFSDDQVVVTQKRKQTQQHLQRKIQQRQQHKQDQQHQLNLLIHPSTPTGKQFTPILPQTQKTIQVAQVSGVRIQAKSQQLQLSPKLNVVSSLQNPPTSCPPVQYNQPSRTLGHVPASITLSPVTPSLTSPSMHSSSPYHSGSPKRSAPCTPRSGTITPSPVSSTPRHTPNGETTRFVFTPITHGTAESKVMATGGETSPPTLKRPTATHPGQVTISEWNNHSNKSGNNALNNPVKDNPVSPIKQPRMVLTNPPATPNKQKNAFNQPSVSPHVHKRTGQNTTSPVVPSSQNSSQLRIPSSPRGPRHNITMMRQPLSRQMSVPSSRAVTMQAGQSGSRNVTNTLANQSLNFSSFDYSGASTNDCRFSQTNALSTSTQDGLVQPNFLDHIPSDQELEALCRQLTSTAPAAVPGNRCHSVPPLSQHLLPAGNTAMQPLTPQTDNRHQLATQNMANLSGHMDGLKQLRNRVLHGDTNNNRNNGALGTGNAQNCTSYAAKRNLMSELESISSSPATWISTSSGLNQGKLPLQVSPEAHSDPLAGLNLEEIAIEAARGNLDMLVDATAEALFADSNSIGHAWNVTQPLTMDSCL